MRSASHRKPLIRNVCVEILVDASQMQCRGEAPKPSAHTGRVSVHEFPGKNFAGETDRAQRRIAE